MTYIPTNKRAPGVRVQMAVSCRRGMVLSVQDGGSVAWEVVRFGPPHDLLGAFADGRDALSLYEAEVKGQN